MLSNGTTYLVYRVALYADGFRQHKSLSDTRSVSGCYMIPLGLSSSTRPSVAATRVLTFTPDGQDVNNALNFIMEDIARAAVEGIFGMDSYGKKVRIFIDPVSFFGDYPAATAVNDFRGHNADAFCSFCAFQKPKSGADPEILYSAEVHSRRLG